MSDTYVECLVKARTSLLGKIFKSLLMAMTVVFILAMFVMPPVMTLALIGAILTGVGAYFCEPVYRSGI